MHRLDEHTFKKIKGGIFWELTAPQAAAKYDVSLKTVLQVRGSSNYAQYREQCKAQHPETQYSLREHVIDLHSIVFNKHDNKYIAPPTARKAVQELKLYFLKENRKTNVYEETNLWR